MINVKNRKSENFQIVINNWITSDTFYLKIGRAKSAQQKVPDLPGDIASISREKGLRSIVLRPTLSSGLP